jgi:periplasmic divalent cation tolerance protein
MTDKIAVLCTCASAEEARRIAAALIDARLAACVNLLPPIRSVYHWKGVVEEGDEILMIIKSTRPLFQRLRDEIARLHSYETPEIIAIPVVDGAAPYLAWMDRELSSRESE